EDDQMNTHADAPPAEAAEASELDLIDLWWEAKQAYERHCERCHACPSKYQSCDVGRGLRIKAVTTASAAGTRWL
uniref:hypothetical protein n=1 Tax=Catenulispora rubra TaxID=280293 RepID=UPI001E493693